MPQAAVDFQTKSTRQQQNPSLPFDSSYKPRAKPRLPKRRHVAKPNNSRFIKNPNSDAINRATIASSSSKNDGLFNGFVFGTSECGLSKPNKERELKEINDGFVSADRSYNIENLKDPEFVTGFSNGVVFGTKVSGFEKPNLIVETEKSNNGFVSSDRNNSDNLNKPEFVSGVSNVFVFGTKVGGLKKPSLSVEMGKNNDGFVSSDRSYNSDNLKKPDFVGGFSNGFVFGAKVGSLENLKLNVEMGKGNDGFVSSDLNNGSNLKKPDLVSGLSNGVVFGKSGSGLKNPSLNLEMEKSNDGFVSGDRNNCLDTKETDSVSGLSNGFVLGKGGSVFENPNLNVETKQSSRSFTNMNSKCNEPNKNDESVKSFSGGFVFSTGKSCSNMRKPERVQRNPRKLGSIFKKTSTQIKLNEENSVPVDSEKMKSRAQGEFHSTDSISGSSSTSGYQYVFENGAEFTSDTGLKIQKEKVVDVFVFGSSTKVNSLSTDCKNPSDDINKPNAEDCRSHTSFVNEKNFVFGKNISAPGVNTTDKLLDDMCRLKITDYNELNTLGDLKEPPVNSSHSADPVFVFESSGKSGAAVSEKPVKFGHFFETFKEKPPTNAQERSSGNVFVGISTPKPCTSQAGQSENSAQSEDQVNDFSKSKENFSQSFFPADLFNVKAFSIGRVEGKNNFSFSTPNRVASSSFAEILANGFGGHPDCSEKSRSIKNKNWKRLSHKSRKVDPIQQQPSKNNEGSQQKAESPGHFSPMDFSPYQDDQCSSSTNIRADTNKGERKLGQENLDFSKSFWERFAAEYPFEQAETVGENSRSGQVSPNNNGGATADTFSKNSKPEEEKECTKQFGFPSSKEGTERNSGSFSFPNEDNVSATKRRSVRKYRTKVGSSPNNIDPSGRADSSYLHLNTAQNKEQSTINSQRPATAWKVKNSAKGDEKHSNQRPTTSWKMKNNVEVNEEQKKQAQPDCEMWRIRGNQAYEKGQSSKAEEYYTMGIDSFINKGSPECPNEPLVLCYSNRAAARMFRGRMREALSDCLMADSLDPSFQKAQLRAANCHLALGETEEACQYFNKCLESNGYVCLDRRIAIEAASGLQKAQKLTSCLSDCAGLLRQNTSTAANSVLESISNVFPTSSYSEKLLELKGEALLMLQRYKEAIQLCEETLDPAEKNFAMVAGDSNSADINSTNSKNSKIMFWRWRLMSRSYFHLGKLELALNFLEKLEVLASSDDGINPKDLSFAATVRDLLHHKTAGNRLFQSGKHTEAVEHYSAAVSGGIESRPFAAVCFCNRAAAQQTLGQLSDAISDCSIAIALDGTYSKAVSRRATLHEKIRDYASATSDLQRLISLLEEQSQKDKIYGSASVDTSSVNNVEELRQARNRLSSIEEKAKKGLPLDHYLILGVKSTDEASELKKAYRRAALKHHPDKAGQFLARADNGDDGRLWKILCEEIQKDADRLFKMIGEAYAVLSDPNKRSEYDLQEELRNVRKENRNQDSTRSYDFYGSPSKNRRNNGKHFQESWKTYGYSRSQW